MNFYYSHCFLRIQNVSEMLAPFSLSLLFCKKCKEFHSNKIIIEITHALIFPTPPTVIFPKHDDLQCNMHSQLKYCLPYLTISIYFTESLKIFFYSDGEHKLSISENSRGPQTQLLRGLTITDLDRHTKSNPHSCSSFLHSFK